VLDTDLVVFVCLAYVTLLFIVAFIGDRQASRHPPGWLSSPLVYTLSISIYCTSWTFFGAVGSAARNGLEFITIYIGPTIVFAGWWLFLRKLVTVGRVHNTTSIADLISARFGKTSVLGALVTVMALFGTTPYIALQLKALTASFQVITFPAGALAAAGTDLAPDYAVAFWMAVGLCVFAIMFGVRKIDVNEHHHGVIAAIAVEAVVKLAALLLIGLWVVLELSGTPAEAFRAAPVSLASPESFGTRWVALCYLAGAAVVCLPRQFHVTVVENTDERQLRTASWLFPFYLFLICIFVVPIAAAGLRLLPAGSDPDLYVLTLPLTAGEDWLGLFAFIGGFSSATSMVIVSSIALSTMISNHVIMPIAVRFSIVPAVSGPDVRGFILTARRISVVAIVSLGLLYFLLSGTSDALAAIGLISFCGVAQFLPSIVGGLYWRGASHGGALCGLAAGFAVWCYTLFLPSFEGAILLPAHVVEHGLFGWEWLRPYALFGLAGFDPLVHSLIWSMLFNIGLFVGVSLAQEPTPIARVQSTLFVDVFRRQTESELSVVRRTARVRDLRQIADRLLGPAETMNLFRTREGQSREFVADDELISRVEARLARSVGAATARSLVSRVVTSETIGVDTLKRLANEAEQIRAYSAELEQKSRQIEAAAAELAAANERLREMDAQKDEFLSQVSHEVRTPMTSIRSLSDILLNDPEVDDEHRRRFLSIIQHESLRLTRLLDDILDLSLLERGAAIWDKAVIDPEEVLSEAFGICEALAQSAKVSLRRNDIVGPALVVADHDKLAQVFINLISNGIKHNTSPKPEVVVSSRTVGGLYEVRIADNGSGVPESDRERIFAKFSRGITTRRSGAGLGLAISRHIIEQLGGSLLVGESTLGGAEFTVHLKLA
jgi:Na+/proline symporter/nitrogen-specific signal transduction histidine kinase